MHDTHGRFPAAGVAAGGLLAVVVLAATPTIAAQQSVMLGEAACTAGALAAPIRAAQIGEPVGGVVLEAPRWVAGSGNTPAHCMVNGSLEPVDKSATARPIRFGVALPAEWNRRAVQMGGGGMNGTIPALAGGFGGASNLAQGFATYGSDSGHSGNDRLWALNDEAIQNLGYLQLKKTHDVAMILIERAYGSRPRYNYFVGSSQGGREALTVAQRYPADYHGVMSSVPIVGFSSLMMSRAHMRIQEIPLRNWVPPAKGNAILAEFMRRCDRLDGLADGIINAYVDCRAIFNVNDGIGEADPWAARRCPHDVDPDPADATQDACLTSGQIQTLHVFFSDRDSEVRLAHGRTNFGMWAPTSGIGNAATLAGAAPAAAAAAPAAPAAGGPRGAAPPGGARGAAPAAGARGGGPGAAAGGGGGGGGGGLLVGQRYRGQEGAAADAPLFGNQGTIGVVGFVMQDLDANPLDLDERKVRARRELVSGWLDSTNPDMGEFRRRGGKLLVTVGTDDTTASSGEQLNFYQTVLDHMGREAVDSFARLYVIPQGGHGLSGRAAPINGDGERIAAIQVPSNADRFALLRNWVENGVAPGRSEVVTAGERAMPMCSFPEYPRYQGGDADAAASYACVAPAAQRQPRR